MKINYYITLLSLTLLSFACAMPTYAQFTYQLNGNPVNTSGWTLVNNAVVSGNQINLTAASTYQAGQVYYSTPTVLTDCAQFTATFEFQFSNPSSVIADGMAFWFITNPPVGNVTGSGLGMPTTPNGLVLALDTYNNDGFPDNTPLASLRFLPFTDYVEGSTTGLLDEQDYLNNIVNVTDGNWHTCVFAYLNGNITVSIDGIQILNGTTASMVGLAGYFGFSASTGASWAQHAIRNVTITGAPNPEPPIVQNQTYCQNDPATPLTATGDVLHWYDALGTPLPSAPTPNTSNPGIFTWYVSQTLAGCSVESQQAEINVTVNAPPAAPTVQYQPTYCVGEQFVPFVVTGTNPIWYDSAIGGVGTTTTPTINTNIAGTYNWWVSQTIGGCESVERAAVSVTVYPMPVADYTYSIHYGCEVDTVYFQSIDTTEEFYIWNYGDGSPEDTGTIVSHVFLPGIYNVQLKSQSAQCADSLSKNFDLLHDMSVSFYTANDTVCTGTPITFTNFSIIDTVNGQQASYTWDLGDGNFQTGGAAFTHIYTEPGTYTVTLTATNGVPCTESATRIITVDPMAQLSIDQSDSLICAGEQISFYVHHTPQGLDELHWAFSDTQDSLLNENPVIHSYDAAGNFTVIVTGRYRACPDAKDTALVAVNPIPVFNLGNDTTICLHDAPIVLTDSANYLNPNAHWQWSNGDTTGTVVIRHHGTFHGQVEVGGCINEDEIIIEKDCYIDIPNSFTPNGDNTNDYFLPRQLLSQGVSQFRMEVFNRWGQIIFETQNVNGRGWDGTYNGKEQPMGVYIYQIDVTMKNGRQEHYGGNVTLLR